jgi:tetratricopeptide (TPR) repeat protein
MKAKERHDIKTDRFLETMIVIEEFFVDNAKKIGITLAAIVIIVAAWIGMSMMMEANAEKAALSLNDIYDDMFSASFTPDFLDEAGEIDLKSRIDDHLTKFSGSAAAAIAEYQNGILANSRNDAETAKNSFLVLYNGKKDTLWALAADQLGQMELKEKNYTEAAAYYQKVADSNNSALPSAYFAWKAGQAFDKADDTTLALRYYNKAKDSKYLALNSMLLAKIENSIKALTAAEVK